VAVDALVAITSQIGQQVEWRQEPSSVGDVQTWRIATHLRGYFNCHAQLAASQGGSPARASAGLSSPWAEAYKCGATGHLGPYPKILDSLRRPRNTAAPLYKSDRGHLVLSGGCSPKECYSVPKPEIARGSTWTLSARTDASAVSSSRPTSRLARNWRKPFLDAEVVSCSNDLIRRPQCGGARIATLSP
jgi:hypothetical protein